MAKQGSWVQHVRFYLTSALLYFVSVAGVGFALYTPYVAAKAPVMPAPAKTTVRVAKPSIPLIAGTPVRIVIPSRYVDLPVIPGTYDKATDSWTLSGYDAQFATASEPANNLGGETFIYGHNNDYVFGALRHAAPTAGAEALIYTSNGHEFAYTFEKTWSVGPYDVATLDYQGPPVLLIQTCTGSFNELRTMYLFTFEKVVR